MTLRFATCRREGFDAGSDAEFCRFLRYAQRSCTEVQSELYVALDQKYVSKTEFDQLYAMAERAKSATGGFIKYLTKSKTTKNQKTTTPLTKDHGLSD